MAIEIDVEVLGDDFLPAYTEGDNRRVVATDSMKNFILRQALAYSGATLEGFLDFLGRAFLTTYPQLERLRLTGREQPFAAAPVPRADGRFAASDVLFAATQGDYSQARLELVRDGEGVRLTGHHCGRVGLRLLKVTGSAFTRFVRDDYTTLPERGDRPLFLVLDLGWEYADPAVMLAPHYTGYVAGEQVRDIVQTVFHQFVSESIQQLLHEMGRRLLERLPHLAMVSFAGQNHTKEPVAVAEHDPRLKVYSEPFPAYGLIRLQMRRRG